MPKKPETLLEIFSHEAINHPPHYKSHPSGLECIQVTEHMPFCLGNAVKYLWRAGLKGSELQDIKKAEWYIKRELARYMLSRSAMFHGFNYRMPLSAQIFDSEKIEEHFSFNVGTAFRRLYAVATGVSDPELLMASALESVQHEIVRLEAAD